MHAPVRRSTYRAPKNLVESLVSRAVGMVTKVGLRLHFRLYRRAVSRGLFPQDARVQSIAGPRPERVLFVGDVAVAGYGVLRHGMGAAPQTAARIAARTGRGMSWSAMTAFDLTARKVATLPCEGTYDIDRVFFMLGIPDVLLGTTSEDWSASIRTVLNRARSAFSDDVQVVFAAIPPMENFRPMPPVARMILCRQVRRLNAAAAVILAHDNPSGTNVFVPAPDWGTKDGPIESRFSWRDLHQQWAQGLADAATATTPRTDPQHTVIV